MAKAKKQNKTSAKKSASTFAKKETAPAQKYPVKVCIPNQLSNKPKVCEYYVPEKITLNRGAVILQPGSTKKYKTGEWRTYKPTIDLAKCIKCGKCWMVCPDAAISKRNADGKYEINHTYCKGCLLCVKECPVAAIPYELDEK